MRITMKVNMTYSSTKKVLPFLILGVDTIPRKNIIYKAEELDVLCIKQL